MKPRTRMTMTAVHVELNEAGGIGVPIRRRRLALGLSQNALAKLAGLTGSAISYIESGERWPQMKSLERLATALGCSVDDLLAETKVSAPPEQEPRRTSPTNGRRRRSVSVKPT